MHIHVCTDIHTFMYTAACGMRSIPMSRLQCQRQLCLTNSFILSLIYTLIHVFPPCVLFYCLCCTFVVVAAAVFLSSTLSFLSMCHSFIHSRIHLCMHGIRGIHGTQLQGLEFTSSTVYRKSTYRECPFRCVWR